MPDANPALLCPRRLRLGGGRTERRGLRRVIAFYALRDFVSHLRALTRTGNRRSEQIEVARAGFVHDADITIEPIEIQVLGEWAFARTQVSGRVRLHNSDDVVAVDVKQLAIYERRQSRGWKIARLIMNSNKN